MMHFSFRRIGGVAVASAILLSASAEPRVYAQTPVAVEKDSEVTAAAALFGGYDTDVTGRAGSSNIGEAGEGSQLGANANVTYMKRSRRIQFSTRANVDSRYYRLDDNVVSSSGGGGVNFAVGVTSRFTVSTTLEGTYQPYYQFNVLPSAVESPFEVSPQSLDYSLSTQRTVQVRGAVSASYKISQPSTFSASYGAGTYRLLGSDARMNTRAYSGGYSRNLTRYATLRLGYGQQDADYPPLLGRAATTLRNRSIDAGIHYSRPLSLTRRTTFGFGTGSAAVEQSGERFFTVTGNARLAHQFGRTWNAAVVYNRGLGIVGGFAEPFFTDAVTTSLEGEFSRRVRTMLSAGLANGNVGLGSRANNYDSVQGEARLEVAVVREKLALFGSYFYYQYSFDRALQLPTGINRRVDRQGVRAGLALTLPITNERTPIVTR